MNRKILTNAILFGCLSSPALVLADARTEAMGGAGTATGSYLAGAFYNPALVAIYNRKDDFGIMLPAIGFEYQDINDMRDKVDGMQDTIKGLDISDPVAVNNAVNELKSLDGTRFLITGRVAGAIAIPNRFISASLFAQSYVEAIALPHIATSIAGDDAVEKEIRPIYDTTVTLTGFQVNEIGIALARYVQLFGQHFTVGVSPKYQYFGAYNYTAAVEDFDVDKYSDDKVTDDAFNVDVGVIWFYGPFRLGLAGKNLIKQELVTENVTVTTTGPSSYPAYTPTVTNYQYTYEIKPLYTVGGAFETHYFTLTTDIDLNKETRFKNFDDDTRMLRMGAEFNLLGQIQLRGGYRIDLEDNLEDTYTAGIGFSPGDMFRLDVAASYANADAAGVSMNWSFAF